MRVHSFHRHSRTEHAASKRLDRASVCVYVCARGADVCDYVQCDTKKNTLLLLLAHWSMLILIYNLSQCIARGVCARS